MNGIEGLIDLRDPDRAAELKTLIQPHQAWRNFVEGGSTYTDEGKERSKVLEVAIENALLVDPHDFSFRSRDTGEAVKVRAYLTLRHTGLFAAEYLGSPVYIPNEDDLTNEQINELTSTGAFE